MGKNGYYSYDHTGWAKPCDVVYSTAGGHETELEPPGAGKHLVILGVMTDNQINLREDHNGSTSTGDILAIIPGDADGIRFPGALRVAENKGIYIDAPSAGACTIFYYIQDNSFI